MKKNKFIFCINWDMLLIEKWLLIELLIIKTEFNSSVEFKDHDKNLILLF